jgi:hypothetical protein
MAEVFYDRLNFGVRLCEPLNFSMEEYMTRKSLTFTAILLAALAMGMHLAHVLELGPKLGWDITLYLPVQTSLYKLFGTIGPVF